MMLLAAFVAFCGILVQNGNACFAAQKGSFDDKVVFGNNISSGQAFATFQVL